MRSLKSAFEDILLLLLGCFTILAGSRAHSLVLAIMAVWMTVQELQQMRIQKSKYINLCNCTDVTVLLLTSVLIFVPPTRLAEVFGFRFLSRFSLLDCDGSRHMAAFLILLSWTKFLLLLQKHPAFAKFETYMPMFIKASWTFEMYFRYFLNSGFCDFYPCLLPLFHHFGRFCNQFLHSLA